MNATAPFVELLRNAIERPEHGVVGLVDELLEQCAKHRLQIEWNACHCRVRQVGSEWEELLESPLRKSAFRAVIARIASLCNDRKSGSVSPYGGKGEIWISGERPTVLAVGFTNTPSEQHLELSPVLNSSATE